MKFKLDENFGTRTRQVFIDRGFDVHTVRDEGLQGATDGELYDVCAHEQRCLVTLDLDFANVVHFPPQQGAGIVVIRLFGHLLLAIGKGSPWLRHWHGWWA